MAAAPPMTDYAVLRRDVRFPISANVLATDVATGARCEGTVKDISRGGCFVQTAQPFFQWARVRLWVVYRGRQFEAEGSVTHARGGQGMGVSFENIAAENQAILDDWLRELGA